jgi:hypothetical protein
MTIKKKFFYSFLIGILLSLLNWIIIDNFIVRISIYKYILIEFVLVISIKFFKFTKLKLNLD